MVSALDEEGVRSVCELLGPNVCYESLKRQLITTFAISQSTPFCSVVQPSGSEDRRTSQLLNDMRAILYNGIGKDTLKQFWLQNLPTSTNAIISRQNGSLEKLAAQADHVMKTITFFFDVNAVAAKYPLNNWFRTVEEVNATLTT